MICLVDTDIVLKLAACDLLSETLTVLNVTRQEVFVFREEAYRVYKHDPDVIRDYTEPARKRALKFINRVGGITSATDHEEQLYMSVVDNIDPGEQVLFGATRDLEDYQLITADRKALRAISYATGCGGICNRLQGRVLCLEQILLKLINQLGLEAVRTKALSGAAYDLAFSAPFQDSEAGTPPDAQAVLRDRIATLRAQTHQLLAPDPIAE